jgi:sirohydrochlorin cobaltochelatase
VSSAILLVAHGSRDRRSQLALDRLSQQVKAQQQLVKEPIGDSDLTALPLLIDVATLELAPIPLHEKIVDFGTLAQQSRLIRLQIVPLFLLAGVHVTVDIPTEVKLAQAAFQFNYKVEICPYLGSHPGIDRCLVDWMQPPAEAWILVAHGSRRTEANQQIEQKAQHLGAIAAYWAVPPDLETQVTCLVAAGYRQIGILPYFLFEGGITDAIATQIQHLSTQFPEVTLQIAQSLASHPNLAKLVVELLSHKN